MKKKFILNTFFSLLMQIVTLVCGFILPRLILQEYGSEVNGLIQSIVQFLGVITFLELGVGQVIQSSLYGPLAKGDNTEISRILVSGNKFFRRIAHALLVYVIALTVFYPYLAEQDFGWMYTAGLILSISIGSFAQYYFGIIDNLLLNADQRGYIQYFSQIVVVILNTVASVWLIGMGCSIQAVKLASSLLYLMRPLAVRWYIRRNYRIDRKIAYTGEPIRQKWNGIAQHVATMVLEGTDTIILTICSTLSNVSIYSVYFMVISGIRQFYVAATAGIQSAVGSLWAQQKYDELRQVFGCVEAVLHFVVVFLFSCMGILIVPFVQVYTDGLTDADYIQPLFAVILVLAYAVRCLRTPYNILILAGGHYRQTQKCHIVTAIMNLVISVAAVSMWGLVGIAFGTLVALIYQTGWMMVYDSRNLLCWPMRRMLRQVAADIITAAVIFFVCARIELAAVSYFAWFIMAVQVAAAAFAVTAAMAFVFYRKQLKIMYLWIARKRAKK